MDDLRRELDFLETLCEACAERLVVASHSLGGIDRARRVVWRLVAAGLLELREGDRVLSLDEAAKVLWSEAAWRPDDDRILLDSTPEGRTWWEVRDLDRLRRILATA